MPAEPSRVRRQLGQELKRLRTVAGLPLRRFDVPGSGPGHIPHPRLQRAELGTALLTEPQLETVLALTGADGDVRERLALLLAHAQSERIRWDAALNDRDHLQGIAADRERDTGLLRTLEVAYLPGLLQTRSYAEALFGHFALEQNDAAAAAARSARQELLFESGREFRFLITRRAQTWAPGPYVSMAAQRDRIEQLATLNAVTVRVLADDARLPMSGFVVHDRMVDGTAMVAIELEHDEVVVADTPDVDRYRVLFDELNAAAEPI